MRRRFNCSDFPLRSARYNRQPCLYRRPFEFRIHLEVAEEFFADGVLPVKRLQIRTRTQTDFRDHPGKLWSSGRLVWNRAGHGINHNVLGARIIFRRISVFDLEHIAHALNQCILKTTTGTKKRPIAFPRELNALEHSVKAVVRAAWRGPKAVKTLQRFHAFALKERRRW